MEELPEEAYSRGACAAEDEDFGACHLFLRVSSCSHELLLKDNYSVADS
jgi:hypothetical protein